MKRPVSDGPRGWAIVLNLFIWPGVGHLVVGRYVAAALWIAAVVGSALLTPVVWIAPLVGMIGFRALSAIEVAFRRGLQRRLPPSRAVLSALAGLLTAVAALMVIRIYCVEAFKIPSAGMVPTLIAGDRVFASKLTYRIGEIERGDLVVFVHPCLPQFDMAERAIALGGDTVEVRCDVTYVNGRALPQRPRQVECRFLADDGAGGWQEEACSGYVETLGGEDHAIAHSPQRPHLDRQRAANPQALIPGDNDFPADAMPSCAAIAPEHEGPAPGRVEPSPQPSPGCGPQRHYVVPAGHVFVMGDNRDFVSDSRSWGPVPVDLVKGRVDSIWWSDDPVDKHIAWDRMGAIH